MTISFAQHRFEGERVIRTSPDLSNRVSSEWYRRPHLYTGRALTADTLISNTKHHIRHLQLSGRHLSRGVIQGLSMSHYVRSITDGESAGQTEQWLRMTPGIGITSWGEDVTLPEPADIFLENIPVWENEAVPSGAGILVLQPLEILDEIVADEDNQCQWDRERDPFDDEQIVDGCRLVFFPWPDELLGPVPRVQNRQFRNQLVYQIFDYEEAHPKSLFPWEYIGIPIGLTYITLNTGKIMFIDQQAVVRQGGAPLSEKSFLTMNGTPFLWESRIQQFIGHIYDISQSVDEIPSAHSFFDVLPPVGVLPKQAINFDEMRSDFFPSQFNIEGVPIPEEQLEVAMNASAGLSPFDLFQPEKIKLLVPVPQSVYEPDLLKKEEPDPVFLETYWKLIREIRQWLSNRSYLRDMKYLVTGAIDDGNIPDFDQDPDAMPDEATPVVLPYDGTLADFGIQALNIVSNLYVWIQKNASGVSATTISPPLTIVDENNLLKFKDVFKGIENFITRIENDIIKTEDLLSSGFVKAEADMYRLRQLLLGNAKASRLATSPAMGQILQGKTRQPSIDDVETYFSSAIKTKPGEVQAASDSVLDLDGKTEEEQLTEALGIMKKMDAGESLSTKEIYDATRGMTSAFSKRVGDDNKAIFMVAQPMKVTFEEDDVYSIKSDKTATIKKYKDSVELSKSVGLERSKPLVDRVYESPSMEVKSNAVKTKTSIFDSLAEIPLDIDDEVTVVGSDKAIFNETDFKTVLDGLVDETSRSVIDNRAAKSGQWVVMTTAPLSEQEAASLSDAQKASINSALRNNRNKKSVSINDIKGFKGTDNSIGKNIREGLFDPDPDDGDEADYFTAGVTALEHGMNAMRVIEKKLADYKKTVKQSRKVLSDLRSNSGRWHDKLGEIDDKLVVLRHDALVTRSLYDEERSRLKAINDRRRTILDTYVSSLVFVRPRLVDPREDVPAVPLYGEYVNPVPACLAEDFEATGELEEMLDVFREVPVSWLTDARGLVRMIKTTSGVADLVKQAGTRKSRIPAKSAMVETSAWKTYNTHEYGKTISKIVHSCQQYKTTVSSEMMSLNTTSVITGTWVQMVESAENQLSLADLIEKGRGGTKLAVRASAVMENLEDVAVSLYYLVNELEPAVKLKWANQISIYDDPVDLRHLEILPGFDRIDVTTRRDLQNMVDWLFSQVNSTIVTAHQTMNDLVRVCILLASHAPVSTIINGYVEEPSTGKIGDYIDISVNQGLVKVGMMATIMTQQLLAVQGVVADVGEKAARIKVTQASDGKTAYSIDRGCQVKFISGF